MKYPKVFFFNYNLGTVKFIYNEDKNNWDAFIKNDKVTDLDEKLIHSLIKIDGFKMDKFEQRKERLCSV